MDCNIEKQICAGQCTMNGSAGGRRKFHPKSTRQTSARRTGSAPGPRNVGLAGVSIPLSPSRGPPTRLPIYGHTTPTRPKASAGGSAPPYNSQPYSPCHKEYPVISTCGEERPMPSRFLLSVCLAFYGSAHNKPPAPECPLDVSRNTCGRFLPMLLLPIKFASRYRSTLFLAPAPASSAEHQARSEPTCE